MKKVSGRLANLTPEQREKLLKKLREQKKEQGATTQGLNIAEVKAGENEHALSFAQQRLWFLDQLEGQQATYNIPAILRIKGKLDEDALAKAFDILIQRHEGLRTRFIAQDGVAKPLVLKDNGFSLLKTDLSDLSTFDQEQQLEILSQRAALKTFSLDKDSLLRAHLVYRGGKGESGRYVLLICMHHIISDAWSMNIFIKEMSLAYSALKDHRRPEFSEQAHRYLDFSLWQKQQLDSGAYKAQSEYWKRNLEGVEVLNLPCDKSRPVQQTFVGKQTHFSLSPGLSDQLRRIAKEQNKTLFMVLLTAWKIILSRYTGQKDFCVGTPVANRNHAELENTIGFFVNTLAIRSQLSGEDSFLYALSKVQKSAVGAFAHQDLPFERLIDDLGLERDMSQSPIFQNFFSYQNESFSDGIDFSGLSIDLESLPTQTAKFDLSLDLVNGENGIAGILEFNTDLFFADTISRLADNFTTLLESIVCDPKEQISNLECLSALEYELQLKEWPEPRSAYPLSNIVEQFEAQVGRNPEAVALRYQDQTWSYKQLNQEANKIAHRLYADGIGEGDFVGLCVERSAYFVFAVMGVIKSGAAYLPIDPSYPSERIKLLIDEGELSALLSQECLLQGKLSEFVTDLSCPVYSLDQGEIWSEQTCENLALAFSQDALLYVIYTSGSTGKPKRTAASHKGESNLVQWYYERTRGEENNKYLLMSPVGFDLGQKNIFTPLLNGGILVLPPDPAYQPEAILDTVHKEKVDCVNCAPSAFYPLLEITDAFSKLSSIKYLYLGGEKIQLEKLLPWLQYSECQLVNSYGPSECTDIASYHELGSLQEYKNKSIPIGRPSANASLYLLDDHFHLVPIGASAQLYIGGDGVGPGYLGQEELTREKFIENPIPGESGRLYATGDLARYTSDGLLEYIGRGDDQLKIRGYRIEVSEIVNTLLLEPCVKDAAVSLHKLDNGREFLAAYLVLNEAIAFDPLYFKKYLKQRLPDFMVPSAFVELDGLPLSPNGKLDLKALPVPELDSLSSQEFVAPSNELEQTLQAIWQQVLGIERIGVHDNFFEIGGDSILSIQIISAARQKQLLLKPNQVFKYPTISELAQVVDGAQAAVQAEQGRIKGQYRLSPVQAWFFQHFDTKPESKEPLNHFNQSVLLDLKSELGLNELRLIAFALLRQHDALNLSFSSVDGRWSQSHRESEYQLTDMDAFVSEANETDLLQALKGAQTQLSIGAGKLFHLLLVPAQAGKEYPSIYIVVHHLVMDGVSWRVILGDLDKLLGQVENLSEKASEPLALSQEVDEWLGEKTHSFKHWTNSLRDLAQGEHFRSDKEYWLETLEQISRYQEIFPSLIESTPGDYAQQKRQGFSLTKGFTDRFLKQANKAFRTDANDILLCALHEALLLGASGSEKHAFGELLVQLESHGRDLKDELLEELSYPDISRTLGWFTSLYPVLLRTQERDQSWARKLKSIKEQLHRVPSKGLSFGLFAYDQNRDKAFDSLSNPSISFNYLGQFDAQSDSAYFSLDTQLRNLSGAEFLDQSAALAKVVALDIVLFISEGCLQCDFLYDSSRFSEQEIDQYLDRYKGYLESLIDYCCAQSKPGLTPSDLSAANLSQSEIDTVELYVSGLTQDNESLSNDTHIETVHELLPTQSGMLFHNIFTGEGSQEESYLEQFCVQLKGDLNLGLFTQAWKGLIKKYANLRSLFYWQLETPLQVVLNDFEFAIERHALIDYLGEDALEAGKNVAEIEKQGLQSFLSIDKAKGFDLSAPPLMRVSILNISDDRFWLVWSYHHILLDGWSVPIVMNDLFENYAELIAKDSKQAAAVLDVQPSPHRFEDYVAWYRANQNEDDLFWKSELADFSASNLIDLEPLSLPIETQLSDESISLDIGAEFSQELRSFAKQNRLTINSLVQGAWVKLLSHYSGDDDIVFGVTVSGRSEEMLGSENIVGMFINTLPLRVRLSEEQSVLELLKTVQDKQQNINLHQSSSLVKIQKLAGLDKDASLFDSILVFENFPVDEQLKEKNQWFEVENFHSFEKTNYPITISVEPGESIRFRVLFDSSLYRKSTIERILAHIETTLRSFIEHSDSAVMRIPYISHPEEKALSNWNRTETAYPRDAHLSELFQEKVEQNPNQLALKFDDRELSYETLNKKANQLARLLADKNCQEGSRVALFMDRSEEFLCSVVATSKLGAVYIPLDPAYPEDRLSYMLEDCQPEFVLSVSANEAVLESVFSQSNETLLYIDDLDEELENFEQGNLKPPKVSALDQAYLMYTSGSTGRPKGVCLNHRSIIRLVVNTWYVSIGTKDRIGHICNVCFDASVYEVWGALLNGASLIGFTREEILSEDEFAEKLLRESVTNMLMPTSLFHLYGRHRPEIFQKMRAVLPGGEPLQPELVRRVLAKNPQLNLLNVYGPTENGVLTTVFDTWNLAEGASITPVGKPISNTTVYILDKYKQQVPVGVIGELYSGGDGVGMGYLNKEELTRSLYVDDPFSKEEGARMYCTGDLARRLPDGNFEVLGRKDNQLKIRGFRIEPSEIIEALVEYEGLIDATVSIVESEAKVKHLVAYYIVSDSADISTAELKAFVADKLPAHMVPGFYLEIAEIPMTPNGKLDTQRLPPPDFNDKLADNYVAPRNEIERSLVQIWSDVLKLNTLGIFDNFFELGGDSIISIQIVSRAKRAGINITPKLLFENPNVSSLAQKVSRDNNMVVADQGLVEGELSLSPAQHWFFEQEFSEPSHFNQSIMFDLAQNLSVQNITPIVSALMKQHDVLRLRFSKLRAENLAKHDNSARSLASISEIITEHTVQSKAIEAEEIQAFADKAQASLSIEKGPLFKVVLFNLPQQRQKLLFIIHHLVIDGVSWRILADDIDLAISQQNKNQVIDFGPKTSSFQFYTKTLEQFAQSDFVLGQKDYWQDLLAQASRSDCLDIIVDKHAQASSSELRFRLDPNLSQSLHVEAHQAYGTEVQDLLLLSFHLALQECGLSRDTWVTLEGHGRDALQGGFLEQIDSTRTIGWFTSMYPVLIPSGDEGLADSILSIKQNLRSIPDKGGLFSLLRYLSRDQEFLSTVENSPAPYISFNYLGQLDNQSFGALSLDESYQGSDNSELNRLSHPLNLSAAFKADCFEFQFLFDLNCFDEDKISELSRQFLSTLEELIQHCMDGRNFGFTPSDIPYFPIEQTQLNLVCDRYRDIAGTPPIRSLYPLSPMQEGMLFHSRLDNSSGMYCEQVSVLLSGDMNLAAMQQAWNEALVSHDILRTVFVWEDLPKPLQLVCSKAQLEISNIDWRDERDLEAKLKRFLQEDRAKGFDFSQAPLMRLHYIQCPSDTGAILGRLIWTYHHILLDGWSMPILMKEVFDRYNALIDSTELSDLYYKQTAGGYQAYIEWLYNNSSKALIASSGGEVESLSNEHQFWRSYLAGFEEPNALGLAKSSAPLLANELRYQESQFVLSEEETLSLQALANNNQVTLNTLMQAAWAILLNRYSGEKDILFGITVSGRPSELENVESTLGLFINTVPFRVQVESDESLDSWLKSIFNNQLQLRQFETSSLVDIQAQSQVDGSRALFDSILVFENYPLGESVQNTLSGLSIEDSQVFEQTNFPLSLIILPGQQLDVRVLFDSNAFSRDSIVRLLQHLKTILLRFVKLDRNKETGSQLALQDIDYLSDAEKGSMLQEWNQTATDYPREQYLHDIVARQESSRIALMFNDEKVSYGQLEEKSSKLAQYLLDHHTVTAGDKVVICLNRSTDLIVSILAILKLGSSYVPLDPGYPEERQRYMLEDTQTQLIITDEENSALVNHLVSNKAFRDSLAFVNVDELQEAILASALLSDDLLPAYLDNEDVPAAILYTSGSTGQPKGVCLTHRGLSRMVMNTNYMTLNPEDRVAHVSNICFDAASFEIWAALLNGLPLVILEKDIMLDLVKFEYELKSHEVSILLITTALFNLVAKEQVSALENINYLFFGGEACNVGMVKRVLEQAQPKHLMHMYGPSENSTYATWYEVKSIEDNAKTVPIGRSVSNSQVYIMNQQGDLLPPGVAGEIVCAGDGLALGYLNKPEQTKAAFVSRSVFGGEPQRMYLTGDLGICLPDGNIEILGRIDNQVKIRGHRIEPEEIIARINALAEIKKAYVLVKDDLEDKKYLVAYFVPEEQWLKELDDSKARSRLLKLKLKELMPEYMVPGVYIEIDDLPLTPNGKIDTKALPDADLTQNSTEYQAPETDLEKDLVAIWEEVLQHERIGVQDDFFELGGHSLLATQIHSRVRQQLSIDIPLRTLFELPTIREFSDFWSAVSQTQNQVLGDEDEEDYEEGEL